jgi:hypothetical protein
MAAMHNKHVIQSTSDITTSCCEYAIIDPISHPIIQTPKNIWIAKFESTPSRTIISVSSTVLATTSVIHYSMLQAYLKIPKKVTVILAGSL